MASEINVDKITPQTGTTLELGDSGDTITVTGTLDGSGLTGLNATNLTSGTVPDARFPATLPALNGSALTNLTSGNLTGALPAIDGSALTGIESGTDWQSTIVTGATLSALSGKGYWIDTTSQSCTITFPSSANVGDTIELVDYARTWGTNKIIIDSNGLNYQGRPDTFDVEYDTSGQALRVVYSGATKGWIPTSDEVSEDNPIPQPLSVDYLCIAGGAGGGLDTFGTSGARASGGGGAGGFLSGTTTIGGGSYGITVGGGGAGGVNSSEVGTNGSNSSIAFTSAVTSIGGGGGGAHNSTGVLNANSGGSGGGGHQTGTGGAGTTGQGSNGRNGGSGNTAGVDGKSWSGNSTTYAGGGAGNSKSTFFGGGGGGASGVDSAPNGTVTQPAYTGGLGGGGASSGTSGNTTGTGGTANTGSGGGGGSGTSNTGGAGGSGLVIIKYSGTTTKATGGTITTSGGNTFHTFTSSGTFTYTG